MASVDCENTDKVKDCRPKVVVQGAMAAQTWSCIKENPEQQPVCPRGGYFPQPFQPEVSSGAHRVKGGEGEVTRVLETRRRRAQRRRAQQEAKAWREAGDP